ncbi:MAG: metallophosphoesterase family protein [Victivallaceae bacterium]
MGFGKVLFGLGLSVFCAAGVRAEQPVAATLRFSPQGKFKIVQFADTLFNDRDSEDNADNSEQAVIERANRKKEAILRDMAAILDSEKPNLVFFSGDNVLTPRDPAGMWRQLVKPLNDRNIPWVAVMGNHDCECSLKPNRETVAALEQLPGSLTACGPDELGGGGNYVLTIKAATSDQPRFALFCMDSGAYADKRLSDGYAWFSPAAIAWFRQQAQALATGNGGKPLPALAFFHIPLPEYEAVQKAEKVIGAKSEDVCSPKINSGMFCAMLESRSILGCFVGHDHNNDYLFSFKGICLGYGRKTGEFCYHGLPSGARVIELEENSRSFSTWIRTADLKQECFARVPESFAKPTAEK